MRQLLFLLRVAFICNILFLLTLAIHFISIKDNSNLLSTVIILGLIIAPCINALLILIISYIYIFKHEKINLLPGWLYITNIIFWLLQLAYIIIPL